MGVSNEYQIFQTIDATDSPYSVPLGTDVVKVDATAGPVSVVLYDPGSRYFESSGGTVGRVAVFKTDSSANDITVSTAAGTILGPDILADEGAGVTYTSDGSAQWLALAGATQNIDPDSDPTFDAITANSLTGGDSSLGITGLSSTQGGAIALLGGPSSTSGNAGGAVTTVGGVPGATGVGGAASITGGAGGATSGAGGAASVTGGAGTGVTTTGGAVSVTGGVGGTGTTTNAGGVGGALTVASGAGGAKTGTGAAAGGAAGALAITGGAGGATASSGSDAGGAGASLTATGGIGGAASAGTGNGGAGGAAGIVGGAGGASTGGTGGAGAAANITAGAGGNGTTGGAGGNVVVTAGAVGTGGSPKAGVIRNASFATFLQGAPATPTTVATLTFAQIATGLLSATPNDGGATVAYTVPTGTDMDAGGNFSTGDSFDWVVQNLQAAQATDTITITANTAHTLVGNVIVSAAHSTTLATSTAVFRSRKTGSATWVTYRVG